MAGEEGQKRKAETPDDGDAAKRQRVEGSNGSGASPAAAAPKKLGIDLEKLQRAKLALQKQKELAERLKKAGVKLGAKPAAAAPGAAAAPAAAAAAVGAAAPVVPAAAAAAPNAAAAVMALMGAPKPATKLPPPLILDEQGREVDAAGRPIQRPNAAQQAQQQQQQQQKEQEEAAAKFFDPGLGTRALRRMDRRPRTSFQFVEEGRLQKQAEMGRLRAKYGDDGAKQLAERRRAEAALAAGGGDANLVPLGARAEVLKPEEKAEEPVPAVEWWDARILEDKSSYGAVLEGGEAQLKADRITIYIEHPVLVEPPAEAPPPPPQPLKLTKRELKKLRTQRRVAREKEKQELVRQGLLEPPAPKVKISNLMRVLGAEATADPTAVEAEVRKQMAERAAAHEDRNLARMLTPAERKDKKMRKLIGEDDGLQKHVALYKVGDLSNAQLRFKVDVNARENHMTGCSLAVAGAFCLVAVEGTEKTLRRYEKLMLRRIDWNAGREEEEEEEEDGKPPKPPNYCHLVWQGVVKAPHFRKFRSETLQSEGAARKILADAGVGHYWELCEAFTAE